VRVQNNLAVIESLNSGHLLKHSIFECGFDRQYSTLLAALVDIKTQEVAFGGFTWVSLSMILK